MLTPQPLKAVQVLFSTMVPRWADGLISGMKNLVQAVGGQHHGDLDLTFDLTVVTMNFKVLSRLYLGKGRV